MDSLPTSTLLAFCGLGIGVIVGAVARSARFCTFGAIEDWVLMDDTRRMKAWGLAIAVAMTIVQALDIFGIVPIGESFIFRPASVGPGRSSAACCSASAWRWSVPAGTAVWFVWAAATCARWSWRW